MKYKEVLILHENLDNTEFLKLNEIEWSKLCLNYSKIIIKFIYF